MAGPGSGDSCQCQGGLPLSADIFPAISDYIDVVTLAYVRLGHQKVAGLIRRKAPLCFPVEYHIYSEIQPYLLL
jgi:hypothetical protein